MASYIDRSLGDGEIVVARARFPLIYVLTAWSALVVPVLLALVLVPIAERDDAPGLAVGARLDGETVYRRGVGMASLEAGVAMSPVTRSRIGSTTKHFTALLALLLAEEGRLDLDVPIRTYLPELDGPGGEPSIRLLLQHRGGSRCYRSLPPSEIAQLAEQLTVNQRVAGSSPALGAHSLKPA